MSPRRRFLGRYSRGAKKNYQVIRFYREITSESTTNFETVINPATVTGVRKVKNFSIEFSSVNTQPVLWALVYVPAGYNPNTLDTRTTAASMYQPTNNVVMAGIYDPQDPGNTARRFTRLSRLLKAGDGLALTYVSGPNAPAFRVVISYAIAL